MTNQFSPLIRRSRGLLCTALIVFLRLCCAGPFATAQTNTFPASGNVGIGVPPAAKLHVKGHVRFDRQSGGSNHLLFSFDASGNYITSDDPGSNHKNFYLQVVSPNNGSAGRHLHFQTGIKGEPMYTRMTVHHNGNVGIGTSSPQAKLAVNGNILAKEVKVKTDISVPDYVFAPDYELPALTEIEAYVKEHRHLPEIPPAKDIQRDGLDLAEMDLLLLKKVEELTLYILQQQKKIGQQEDLLAKQQEMLLELRKEIFNRK